MTASVESHQAEDQVQRPQKISFFRSLRQGGHFKCLLLTLLIISCGTVITWCRVAQVSRLVINFHNFPVSSREKASPCDDGYIYIPVAFMVMLYLVYLVECWHCSTRLELTYKIDVEDVCRYIEQMRESQPIIWWKSISYHYIRRSRQVTRYRNGDAYTTSHIYYERVNSRASASCFVYAHCGWKDISKKLVDLEKHTATKIRFSKGFAFANLETATDFEEQRMRFFRENESSDDYTEMREGLDLLGVDFQEYMVTFASKDQLPWYVSHAMFWAFSLLLMSWPFRVIIDCKTAYVHYQVAKIFGVNPISPSTVQDNQLPRINTMDSLEIERVIADGVNLAPSYSEAILLGRNIPNLDSVETGFLIRESSPPWPLNHRSQRRHSDHREGIPPSHRRIPKSFSQPFKPLQDMRRFNFGRRHCFTNWPEETPPCYEDAVLFSYPLVSYMSLRRSATDRDLSSARPLRTYYRSLSNLFHWHKRSAETTL